MRHSVGVTGAELDVLNERQRQRECYGEIHDDHHVEGEIAEAAAAYAALDTRSESLTSEMWPWRPHEFKPRDRRSNLVRAGALILAEIERLDRAAAPKP